MSTQECAQLALAHRALSAIIADHKKLFLWIESTAATADGTWQGHLVERPAKIARTLCWRRERFFAVEHLFAIEHLFPIGHSALDGIGAIRIDRKRRVLDDRSFARRCGDRRAHHSRHKSAVAIGAAAQNRRHDITGVFAMSRDGGPGNFRGNRPMFFHCGANRGEKLRLACVGERLSRRQSRLDQINRRRHPGTRRGSGRHAKTKRNQTEQKQRKQSAHYRGAMGKRWGNRACFFHVMSFSTLDAPGRSTLFSRAEKAGKGNRTLIASLEGWSFTIKLCPRAAQGGFVARNCQPFSAGQAHLSFAFVIACQSASRRVTTPMKLLRFFLLVTLFATAAARADLTIVQKVEGDKGANEITMKVKGSRARVDVNPQLSTILDAQSGELLTIFHDQKKVMRISGERAKAMADMAQAMSKDVMPNNEPPKATGKKQKVNGYETAEYSTVTKKAQTSYWVATDYPQAKEIMKQMNVLQSGAFAALRKSLPSFQDLPGLPLRTEIKVDGQNQMTSTIQSVDLSPVPDSVFEIPAGYSEMKLPDFLGGKGAPGQE